MKIRERKYSPSQLKAAIAQLSRLYNHFQIFQDGTLKCWVDQALFNPETGQNAQCIETHFVTKGESEWKAENQKGKWDHQ